MVSIEEVKDVSLLNTFRIKARAAAFVEYDSIDDLARIDFAMLPKPVRHIGSGSNLLFTKDFPGTLLHSQIRFLRVIADHDDDVLVEAGAGVPFDSFVEWACALRLWGVENLSKIPGEIGAAAVQNIGAYGVEAADNILRVNCFDIQTGRMVTFEKKDCRYGYRTSVFKEEGVKGRYIVTSVLFQLTKEYSPKLEYGNIISVLGGRKVMCPNDVRKVVISIRDSKLPDPKVIPSAGSYFKNPVVSDSDYSRIKETALKDMGGSVKVPGFDVPGGVKVPAAWLIDSLGLKGTQVGGAAVYENQPLVIVNRTGKATAKDVMGLEELIVGKVKEKYGISLEREVEHL